MIDGHWLEQIIYCSGKDEFITKELIKKIIENIINSLDNDTKEKFNGVIFANINWNCNAVCSCRINTGDIVVNYERFIKLLKQEKKLNFLQRNLEILINLLHEIEHLKEINKSKNLTFESFLHSYSNIDIFDALASEKLTLFENVLSPNSYQKALLKLSKKLYLQVYDKIPSERIATINSHKLVFESLNNYEDFNEKYRITFNYINQKYLEQYYMGYNTKKSEYLNIPLVDYFKFIGMLDLLNNLDFYDENIKKFRTLSSKEFTLEQRMLYGLPVSLQETKELEQKILLKR